jgi:hypothetical protein
MEGSMQIPENPGEAIASIADFLPQQLHRLHELPRENFLKLWCAVAYLNPGLHPDAYEAEDSGWPEELRPVAAEAWRRAVAGELADGGLYPADAAWAGLCDRMADLSPLAARRREVLRRGV